MKTDSSKQNNSDYELKADQFAEPRGMSVGWDLSNLPTNSGSKANGKDLFETRQADGDQTPDMSAHADTSTEYHPDVDIDPFPVPRTVPTNWNVSALL